MTGKGGDHEDTPFDREPGTAVQVGSYGGLVASPKVEILRALVSIDATIEGVTGLALIIAPGAVAWLLFGVDVPPVGPVLARFAGIALVSFATACLLVREKGAAVVTALLAYNVLSAAYLAIVGLQGGLVGVLLWPAAGVHTAVSVLFAGAWRRFST
jgi:hypothetical protein